MSTAAPKTSGKSPNMAAIGSVDDCQHACNYSVVRLGPAAGWRQYGIEHPASPTPVMGKVFLKEHLELSGMEVSCGVMGAHAAIPFYHQHRENEELYLFVKGKGQMQIDGELIDVEEGTVVRVAPAGARAWRNLSSEDLVYIVIQAKSNSLTQWTLTDGVGVPDPVVWPKSTETTER